MREEGEGRGKGRGKEGRRGRREGGGKGTQELVSDGQHNCDPDVKKLRFCPTNYWFGASKKVSCFLPGVSVR